MKNLKNLWYQYKNEKNTKMNPLLWSFEKRISKIYDSFNFIRRKPSNTKNASILHLLFTEDFKKTLVSNAHFSVILYDDTFLMYLIPNIMSKIIQAMISKTCIPFSCIRNRQWCDWHSDAGNNFKISQLYHYFVFSLKFSICHQCRVTNFQQVDPLIWKSSVSWNSVQLTLMFQLIFMKWL